MDITDITDELLNELKEDYKVEYDEKNKAWRRFKSGKVKVENIKKVMTMITGEVPTTENTLVGYKNNIVVGGSTCICGCGSCKDLYKLFDKKTYTCFLLGSDCINLTHLNYSSDLKCGEKNGFCKDCDIPLRLNGERKNYNKNRCDDTCNHCYDTDQRIIRQQKQEEQKVLNEIRNEIRMREQEKQKVQNEIRMKEQKERLKRIQTIFLTIKFEDKDKYRIYGTCWNPEKKLWYWTGDINDFPPKLIPLKRV